MSNVLKYKGYQALVEYSAEDNILFGKIMHINDLVNFEGNVDSIESAFKEAVEDYLETCKELGREPEKAYSGSFNVRIKKQLHRRVAFYAIKTGKKINNVVEEALASYVPEEP